MRWILLLALLPVAGCSSGGGTAAETKTIQLPFDFSLVRADAPTTRAIDLPNPFDAEAVYDVVESPGSGFSFDALFFPAIVVADGKRTLDLTFAPGIDVDVETELVLRVTSGKQKRTVRIPLHAALETPTVELQTPVAVFGDVLVGESGSRSIRVRNSSLVTPVRVIAAGALPAGFSLSGASVVLVPGAISNLSLDYVPALPASHDFPLTLTHDAAGPPLEVAVTAGTSTWVEEIVTDFGSIALVGGETAWLEVDVSAHAISRHLEATVDGATIGLLGFEGPGGQIYENDSATGEFLWFVGDGGVFTATLPSSDRPELMLVPGGGLYRFRFYLLSGTAAALDVRTIVHNRLDAVVAGGTLDLNVFLADGLGISAVDAPTDPRLSAILDEADRIFGQQGLSIGDVDYYVLTDASFDQITTDQEFGDLLEESVQASEARLNLFFVETAMGGGVLGVAARLGGTRIRGTRVSGVMIDFDFGTTAQGGYITAHESGHFLGLLHTTEQSGEHDLIDDTAECLPTQTDAICSTVGNDYLMHWRILSADPVLTDGQSLVILGHPLVGPAQTAPSLAAFAPARSTLLAPLLAPPLAAAMPENWCGTANCCKTAK